MGRCCSKIIVSISQRLRASMTQVTIKQYLEQHPAVLSYRSIKRRLAANPQRYGAVKVGNVWTLRHDALFVRERRKNGER